MRHIDTCPPIFESGRTSPGGGALSAAYLTFFYPSYYLSHFKYNIADNQRRTNMRTYHMSLPTVRHRMYHTKCKCHARLLAYCAAAPPCRHHYPPLLSGHCQNPISIHRSNTFHRFISVKSQCPDQNIHLPSSCVTYPTSR